MAKAGAHISSHDCTIAFTALATSVLHAMLVAAKLHMHLHAKHAVEKQHITAATKEPLSVRTKVLQRRHTQRRQELPMRHRAQQRLLAMAVSWSHQRLQTNQAVTRAATPVAITPSQSLAKSDNSGGRWQLESQRFEMPTEVILQDLCVGIRVVIEAVS